MKNLCGWLSRTGRECVLPLDHSGPHQLQIRRVLQPRVVVHILDPDMQEEDFIDLTTIGGGALFRLDGDDALRVEALLQEIRVRKGTAS